MQWGVAGKIMSGGTHVGRWALTLKWLNPYKE